MERDRGCSRTHDDGVPGTCRACGKRQGDSYVKTANKQPSVVCVCVCACACCVRVCCVLLWVWMRVRIPNRSTRKPKGMRSAGHLDGTLLCFRLHSRDVKPSDLAVRARVPRTTPVYLKKDGVFSRLEIRELEQSKECLLVCWQVDALDNTACGCTLGSLATRSNTHLVGLVRATKRVCLDLRGHAQSKTMQANGSGEKNMHGRKKKTIQSFGI